VDRHSAGLVDHQYFTIAMQHAVPDLCQHAVRYHGLGTLANMRGRDTNLVASAKPGRRLAPLPVDAHLARPDQAIKQGSGQSLELGGKKIINPLPIVVAVDGFEPHAGRVIFV
jgi:hypothetical protein